MSVQFTFNGDIQSQPAIAGSSSGQSVLDTPFQEAFNLSYKKTDELPLDADGAIAVPLPGNSVKQAHVVVLKASGGKVIATITSADGLAQTISFDSVLLLINLSSPVTALTLTRMPATPTTVSMFLGQL